MTFSAKILKDSISNLNHRITTFEITYPRIIHSEQLRHRIFNRCVASSRAIPVEKMIKQVEDNPYIPTYFGKNQKGMSAEQELSQEDIIRAKEEWLAAKDDAVKHATNLKNIGLHKELTNRVLEPYMWITEILTGTDFSNFFNLRCEKTAMPEIRKIAGMMNEVYCTHIPNHLEDGEWHLPLLFDEDKIHLNKSDWIKISCGRVARTSYLTHDGKRDLQADIDLHDRLLSSCHMSPTEHVARPMTQDESSNYLVYEYLTHDNKVLTTRFATNLKLIRTTWFSGNLNGWISYRKTIPYEFDKLGFK